MWHGGKKKYTLKFEKMYQLFFKDWLIYGSKLVSLLACKPTIGPQASQNQAH